MGMSNAVQMWGVVAVYLLACIGAGFITARKAKTANAEDYFTSKISFRHWPSHFHW